MMRTPVKILAVVGLPGAGKSVTVRHFLEKTGWARVYFGAVVFEEMDRRGLPVNEANERAVREELRTTYGMGMCATLTLPKLKALLAEGRSVCIESLYSWEEYATLKREFGDSFRVLAILASPETRKARMAARLDERPLTPAEVESRDYAQIENLHQAGPIARADYFIVNESTLDELYWGVDTVIEGVSGA